MALGVFLGFASRDLISGPAWLIQLIALAVVYVFLWSIVDYNPWGYGAWLRKEQKGKSE